MKRGILVSLAVLAIAVVFLTLIGTFDLAGASRLLVLAGAGLVLVASVDGLASSSNSQAEATSSEAGATSPLEAAPSLTAATSRVDSDSVIDLREPAAVDLVDELIADGQLTARIGPLSDSDVETMLMVALSA